jgi:hypothetical protein
MNAVGALAIGTQSIAMPMNRHGGGRDQQHSGLAGDGVSGG